jgi:hypothetical protein
MPTSSPLMGEGWGGGGLVIWETCPETPPHPKPLPIEGRGFQLAAKASVI